MMAIAKTVTLYSFDELDIRVQDRIIGAYIQDLPGWWSDEIEERIKNEAIAMGIDDFDFVWSGFWSQGDGLSFTGTLDFKTWLFILDDRLDREQFSRLGEDSAKDVVKLKESNRIDWGGCIIERINNHYCHENTVQVLVPNSKLALNGELDYPSDNERMERFGRRIQRFLNEWKNELCHRWYSELQEEYESYTTRENIVKDIVDRKLLYTSSGTILYTGELI